MIPLVLAAVVAAGIDRHPPTLAGVTLGSNLTQVLAQNFEAQQSVNSASRWFWRRQGGGTVAVTADGTGKITRVNFVADKSQHDNIDLPCVPSFPVRDSDASLQRALDKTVCSAFNGAAYGFPGGSVVEIRFDGSGEDRLVEATWYRPSDDNPSPVGHMHAVIDYLQPTLAYFGAARIYYAATCSEEQDQWGQSQLFFPAVNLERPLQGATGITAVQQIFRSDPHVSVTQARSGMLRITIGEVSTALLQTRMPTLALTPADQYSAPSALLRIMTTPDFLAAERHLDIVGKARQIDIIVGGPVRGAPHLPSVMHSLSVDEALDSIARTFKGIVMYGICTQPNGEGLLELDFSLGV